METIVRQLIADSMEMTLPPLTTRMGVLPELADVASVIIGMRRTGKTYDPLYFSRLFRKNYGISPRAYRESSTAMEA